jgi:hypothetical protein
MNDVQVLERLSSAYETLDAPPPSAALAEVLESGTVGAGAEDDERRDAVVVPLVRPQTRLRVRHLVAAVAATFVLFSGLAVAGALPDPVQRQVSSVVSHLGIDLPTPTATPARNDTGVVDTPRTNDRAGSTTTSEPVGSTTTTVAGGALGAPAAGGGTTPGAPATTTPANGNPIDDVGGLGAVPGDGGPVTTLPPSGGDPLLPPISLPPISLPPIGLPPILPPISLPPITLPPIQLPLLQLSLGL